MGDCASTSNSAAKVESVQSDATQMLEHQVYPDDWLANPAELHFSCEGLPKLDLASKSDPYLVLFSRDRRGYSFLAIPFCVASGPRSAPPKS